MTTSRLFPTPSVCGNYNRKEASKTSGDGLATFVLRQDSPAKISVAPVSDKALKANAQAYGQSSPVYLANYDPDTQSWRTCQRSFLETEAGGFQELLETWPRLGMTVNGIAYQLPTLVPLTVETGSGLLPTPTASDGPEKSSHG